MTSDSPPLLIRDKILAFLSEPRSARSIAAHIGRPVPTATGHLASLRRQGLVQRLGYAAYALADYTGPPVVFRRPPRRYGASTSSKSQAPARRREPV